MLGHDVVAYRRCVGVLSFTVLIKRPGYRGDLRKRVLEKRIVKLLRQLTIKKTELSRAHNFPFFFLIIFLSATRLSNLNSNFLS